MIHTKPVQGATNEWLTPPEIIQALGPFDLDPCSPVDRPWDTAAAHYTKLDDGLSQPWNGFVWCNPPYGRETWAWLAKLADHGDGIALIFARTETVGFQREVWGKASALLFMYGRPTFYRPDGTPGPGNSGGGMVLVAYGDFAAWRLLRAPSIPGYYVTLSSSA